MKKYFLVYFCITIFLLFLPFKAVLAQTSSKAERLENLLKLSQIDTSKVNILNALFDEYESTAPFKAKKYAEDALKLSEKNRYQSGIITSSDNIGKIYHKQGAYAKAVEYYSKSLAVKELRKGKVGIADSYISIGNAYVLLDEFDNAVDFYVKSLKIRESLQDLKGLSVAYTNLGVVYYRAEKYNEALDFHKRALSLADSLKDKQVIAINLSRLGETYFRQKNYKDALLSYRQLLQLAQKNGINQEEQKAFQGLSQVYAAQDDYKKAYEYYQSYAVVKESIFRQLQSKDRTKLDSTANILTTTQHIKNLQDEKIKQQNLFTWVVSVALGIILIIAFFLYRNNLLQVRTNRLLEQQKTEIELKNNKLEDQKRKIESQNEAINRKNATLEATFKEIERKNKDITASINYAKRIQESMLPRNSKIAEALPEHFILFKPRDIVSGDFYWFSQKNGKIIIAAVDCTGHGVPGAIMSMLADSYLNQIINLQGILEPDIVLTELHKNIGNALNQEETNNQDGMDIALCIIDKGNEKLEFAGAGRSLLLIRNGEYEDIMSCKLPIGGFQKDRPREFIKYEFNLDTPIRFYIFSDGYQDQFGGIKGRKFAKSRLIQALVDNHLLPMQEQRKMLNKTLKDWMGQNRQMDDILVIGVSI